MKTVAIDWLRGRIGLKFFILHGLRTLRTLYVGLYVFKTSISNYTYVIYVVYIIYNGLKVM